MLQPDLLAELGERFSPSFTHLLIFAPPALLTSLRGGYLTHFLLFPLPFSPLLSSSFVFFSFLSSQPLSPLFRSIYPHTLFLALSVGEGLGRPATVKCRIGVDDEDSYEGTYVRIYECVCVSACENSYQFFSFFSDGVKTTLLLSYLSNLSIHLPIHRNHLAPHTLSATNNLQVFENLFDLSVKKDK